ncbi:methyltransferase [Streptomyces sp. NPDC050636]|uniref:methyltransferase n=1 Tax=Streptomyces sp. NPDC050636 TaxID=3154510 RepID=UPI003426138A
MGYTHDEWHQHYDDGRCIRQLGNVERVLLTEHIPAPDGGRALDVGCGTGELAAFVAQLGYTVDAVDFAEGALPGLPVQNASRSSLICCPLAPRWGAWLCR